MGMIRTQNGETVRFSKMSGRAAWSYVRLQAGSRIRADAAIRDYRERLEKELGREVRKAELMPRILEQWVPTLDNQREIQFIFSDDKVVAVASTKHLLIPAEEVMAIARRVSPGLQPQENFTGLLQEFEELPGITLSWHLDPGDILTRRAIRMGVGLRVISCFNPLTFVGASGFDRFFGTYGRANKHEKILRVERKIDLEDRIRDALAGSGSQIEAIKEEIANAKKVNVKFEDAKVLLTAFPISYSAGKKTVKQIVERYRIEDQTLWGLAQAASYVARHGEFRSNAETIDRKLAVVGAAYFNISDVDGVADNCRAWLKKRDINLEDWL